ncbi:putative LRR containing protein [Trachipleistophora hominis]|uniref:Putative LRR containing protein n=1 Tax=Trachipleistophora hominis TaxID=72359 RepID=L7JT01_TRAHO|nr:putative LRR containing protein [Trachipleistophora hominis]
MDFNYIAAKLMYLYCDNCKFGALTRLPPQLVELHINNSEINGNLELPEGLGSIVLECTSIHSNVVLTIKDQCKRIEIYKTVGVISFPSIWRLTGIEFSCYYEKVDLWRISDDLFQLVRIIGALIVKNIELGFNTKILQLINVKMSNDSIVKIHRSCNNIMVKDCTGCFDLSDIVVWGKIKFSTDTNSLKLIRSTTKNTCELLIVNIDYVKPIFTNRDIINLYISSTMNFDTDLCLKIHRIVEYVTSWHLKYYLDIPFLMFNGIISRRDQGIDYEFYQCDDNGKSKVIIKNAYIQGMVQFINRNIKEISLINVRVMTGQVLVINTAYESLFMKNCSGRFNIYGIIVSGENYVDLPDTNNHIWFYRVEKDIYNCELSRIPVNKKFTIAHNLQSARLSYITVARRASFNFAQGCKNLCLFDC